MKESKIIVLTCVHGRKSTVLNCIKNTPEIERVIVYSDHADRDFLDAAGEKNIHRCENYPLSNKWNYGLSKLKDIDFDGVIMMGSDDYFDQRFLDFVKENIPKYDMIGFTDLYFKDIQGVNYYWDGYKNHRRGEPAGAGKTYSKEYLEKINYNLFPYPTSRGLDGQAWTVVNFTKANMLLTSLRENNLFLCDVKDGQGITPLASIKGIVRV